MSDHRKCMCGEVTRAFRRDMTARNYVRLRRRFPKSQIDIRLADALEFAYSDLGLEDFEISPYLLAEAVTGNRNAVCELSLVLLEHLCAREDAARQGATHLVRRGVAISDAMVNQLINWMIDGLIGARRPRLPADLVVLIRHQTGGIESDWHRERKNRERRAAAVQVALALALSGEVPTVRRVGRAVGVNASTVTRWFANGWLDGLKPVAQLASGHSIVTRSKPLLSAEELEIHDA